MFGIFSWIKIAALVAIVTFVGAAWWHYTSLVSERDHLKQVVAIQQQDLENWSARWKEMEAGLSEVARLRKEANQYNDELKKLLAKHDLNGLAVAKPKLIERRVNSATAKRFRVLECITNPDCPKQADPATSDQTSSIEPGQVVSARERGGSPVLLSDKAIREPLHKHS